MNKLSDNALEVLNKRYFLKDFKGKKKGLQSRLVALYKFNRKGGIVRTAFSSQSPADLSRKIKYLLLVLERDRAMISRMNETRELKARKKGALMENRETLQQTSISRA